MIVVADTTPLNYLLLIGEIDLLPFLYQAVLIPPSVHKELRRPGAPAMVAAWAASLPSWCEVRPVHGTADARFAELDGGEPDAIALALESSVKTILMDDEDGRNAAASCALTVTGTLGVLKQAALAGAVDLREAFRRLEETNFRMGEKLKEDFWRST